MGLFSWFPFLKMWCSSMKCDIFHHLNFYPSNLMNSFISSNNFWWCFPMYSIMLSVNSAALLFFFAIWIPLIYFFMWLLCLGLAIPCWIKVESLGILIFPLVFRKCPSAFLLNEMLAGCFSYVAFIMFRYVSHYHYMESFNRNRYWILSKVLLASIEIIILFLFLNLLVISHWFADIETYLNPWEVKVAHGV